MAEARKGKKMDRVSLLCEVCNITLSCEKSMADHKQGKKHQNAVRGYRIRKQGEAGIFIHGLVGWMKEHHLAEYFSQFGEIEDIYINREKRFSILTFAQPESRKYALSRYNHFYNGVKFLIKPAQTKAYGKLQDQAERQANEEEAAKKSVEMLEQTGTKMLACKDFEDQVTTLRDTTSLLPSDKETREGIMRYIEDLLRPYLPGCSINPFGSSVNGFGVHGCDLDMFLDMNLDEEIDMSKLPQPKRLPYLRDLTALLDGNGCVSRQRLREADLPLRLKFVSRVLIHDPRNSFTDLLTIPSTRVPIVRCIHRPSKIQCDVSINNGMPCRNTALIRYLSSSDRRIPLLIFALRFWAKKKDLVGSGARLSSYALTWLMYYYLQNTSPPVLPTIERLASLAGTRTMIEVWDCSFPSEDTPFPPTENRQTIAELLTGFFDFWQTIDFESKLVCTRTGTLKNIKVKDEMPEEQQWEDILAQHAAECVTGLSWADQVDEEEKEEEKKQTWGYQVEQDEKEREEEEKKRSWGHRVEQAEKRLDKSQIARIARQHNFMAVQDPFVMTHNITSNLNLKTLLLFLDEIQQASAKCQKPKFLKPSADPALPWGLCYLGSPSRILIQNPKSGSVESLATSKVKESRSESEYFFSFRIQLESDREKNGHADLTVENVKDWCKEAGLFFRKVYDEIFFFETVDLEDEEEKTSACLKRKSEEKECELGIKRTKMCDSNESTSEMNSSGNDSLPNTIQKESCQANGSKEQDCVEYPVLQVYSTVKERLWNTRKKWRERALTYNLKKPSKHLSPQDFYKLEKTISEMIRSQEVVTQRTIKAPFQFSTLVKASMSETQAIVYVWMYPNPAPNYKEFKAFYDFFNPFFARLIQECLGKV